MEINNDGINPIIKNAKKKEVKKTEKEEITSFENPSAKKSPVNPNFYSNYLGITSFKGTAKKPETDTERLEYLKSLKDTDGTPLFEEGVFDEKTDDASFTKSLNKNESYRTLYQNQNAFDAFCLLQHLKESGETPVVRKDNLPRVLSYTDIAASSEAMEMWNTKGNFIPNEETENLLKQLLNAKNDDGSFLFPNFDEVCFLFAMLKLPSLSNSEMIDIIKSSTALKENDENSVFNEELTTVAALYKTSQNPSYDISAKKNELKELIGNNIDPLMAVTITDFDEEQHTLFNKLYSYKSDDNDKGAEKQFFSAENVYRIITSGKTYDEMFDDIELMMSKKDADGKQIFNGFMVKTMLVSDEDTRNRILNFVKGENEKIKEYERKGISSFEIMKFLSNGAPFSEVFKSDESLERAITIAALKDDKGEPVVPEYYCSSLIKKEEVFNTFMKYHKDFINSDMGIGQILKICEKGNDTCERATELLKIKKPNGERFFPTFDTDKFSKDEKSFELSKLIAQQKDKEGACVYSYWQIENILEKGENFVDIMTKLINKTTPDGKKHYNPNDLRQVISLEEEEIKLLDKISESSNKFGENLLSSGKEEIDFVTRILVRENRNKQMNSEKIISNLTLISEIRNPENPEQRLFNDDIIKAFAFSENTDEIIDNVNKLLNCKNEKGETVFKDENTLKALMYIKDGTQKAIDLYNLTDKNGERIFTYSKPILEIVKTENLDRNKLFNYAKELSENLNCNCTKEEKESLIATVVSRGENDVRKAVELKDTLLKSGKIKEYGSYDFLTGVNFFELFQKTKISHFSLAEKKSLLKKIVNSNTALFYGSQSLREDFPLLPKDKTQYCDFLQGLAKSIGIETNPLTTEEINKFNENISELSSLLQNPDIKPLALTQKISTKQLQNEIEEKTKNLDLQHKKEVYDYFCFDIVNGKLKGYPANLFNGKKLSQIANEETRHAIEELRPFIKEYSENNPVTVKCEEGADKAAVNKLNKVFNEIISALPEFRTTIEKAQHRTHSYDLAMHSLNVLREVVNDDNFKELNESDKKVMVLASLLHDITKAEGVIDKTHEKESGFDAFFITEKLNLSQSEKSKLYDLIANHEWFEHVNNKSLTENQRNIVAEDMAFALRSSNTFKLAQIFTKADLKSVSADNWFYDIYIDDMPKKVELINKKIDYLKSSQPMLPLGVLPKAGEIKEGNGVYGNENGNVIIKLNEITDFEKIGFPKGTNQNNFKIMVHALERADQLARFTSFSLADSDALLSTSYIIKPQTEYRVFRPQGLIINTDTSNIHAGVNMDYGTGCGKNLETLKRNFMFGAFRAGDRTYFSDLVKSKLSLSDEEYNKLVEKYSNKTFVEIEKDNPEICEKLIETFDEIELGNRRHGRAYNEVLITRPQISGVFLYDTNMPSNIGNPVDFIERQKQTRTDVDIEYLLDYAKENDLPIIVFGD